MERKGCLVLEDGHVFEGRMIGADQGQARHAVHVRQLQIQQQQIDRRRAQGGLRLGQAGAFDDLGAFGRLFDSRLQRRPKQGVVVGDDDAIHECPSHARFLFRRPRRDDTMPRLDFGRN